MIIVFGVRKNDTESPSTSGFSVRGTTKVAAEFSIVSLTHNLKKMVTAAKAGLIRQENGKWVAAAV